MNHIIELNSEEKSLILGELLASSIKQAGVNMTVISLSGELGAGKTTLSRGILRLFGHDGKVKSPTYTLVEPYELETVDIYHFDLYRLGDPEELEFMGIRDYFETPQDNEKPVVCIVEWPDKGRGYIPEPDIAVELSVFGEGRQAKIMVSNTVLSDQIDLGLSKVVI